VSFRVLLLSKKVERICTDASAVVVCYQGRKKVFASQVRPRRVRSSDSLADFVFVLPLL